MHYINLIVNTATFLHLFSGFAGSSVGKASTCNARDRGSIPVSGRSPGEGIGYPLKYSWTSLVVQLVKNPLARLEMGSIPGLRDPLEKGKTTYSSILDWNIPWTVFSTGSKGWT